MADQITVSLSTIRAIDGISTHAKRVSMTPEAYCLHLLRLEGERRADQYNIGAIASSQLLLRFTDEELSNIRFFAASEDSIVWPELPEDWDWEDPNINQELAAAQTAAEDQLMIYRVVQGLLKRIGEQPIVRLDDEELIQGMQLLVSLSLLTPERVGEILFYKRPSL